MNKITEKEILELRNKEAVHLVLQGCGGDLQEWVDGIKGLLVEEKVLDNTMEFPNVYSFTNKDFTNMIFELPKETNMGRLAVVRIMMRQTFGAMWLEDYIDNGYLEVK